MFGEHVPPHHRLGSAPSVMLRDITMPENQNPDMVRSCQQQQDTAPATLSRSSSRQIPCPPRHMQSCPAGRVDWSFDDKTLQAHSPPQSHMVHLTAPGSVSPHTHFLHRPHRALSPLWPEAQHLPPNHHASHSIGRAYLEARALRASRTAQAEKAAAQEDVLTSSGSSSSEDEHQQVTQLLLAAVQSSERQRVRHARTHSWAGSPEAPARTGRHAPPARHSTDLPNPSSPQPPSQEDTEDSSSQASVPGRKRGGYHLTSGKAAVELFLRLRHARQTVEFARRQAVLFSTGCRCTLSLWESLEVLNELREYEAVLFRGADPVYGGQDHLLSLKDEEDPGRSSGSPVTSSSCSEASHSTGSMTLLEHAYQTAELCRAHFPDKDYMHLAGLIHGLGKLLAHPRFGSQPQWAVSGESFPVGCRFASGILGSQYFAANADRRRRMYNSPYGIYTPRCGLSHCVMSWGAPEYLYEVLQRSGSTLPREALFCIRHQKFYTLPGGAYNHLLSAEDQGHLPSLRVFQSLTDFRRRDVPGPQRCVEELKEYYSGVAAKYLPDALMW